jgi:hypothetical protein
MSETEWPTDWFHREPLADASPYGPPNSDHQQSDGGSIEWFPTETVRPMESLDDGGIIIIGGFPTETVRPMESIHPFEVLI